MSDKAPAVNVTDDMVERLRRSLWSTWGKDRPKTTDWPSDYELRRALAAALEQPPPAVAMGQKIAAGMRRAQ
jgi:hypothetical protein